MKDEYLEKLNKATKNEWKFEEEENTGFPFDYVLEFGKYEINLYWKEMYFFPYKYQLRVFDKFNTIDEMVADIELNQEIWNFEKVVNFIIMLMESLKK